MRGQLVNYILHAPTEGPAVVDKEDVIEDDGSDEQREEGSVHEGCIQHGEEDRERTLEEMKNMQGEAEQFFPEDPGLWPEGLTKQQREIIVCALASKDAEESNKLPPTDMEGKPFPMYLQFAKSANGREKIKRDWLIHSETAKAFYCIPCLQFSHELSKSSKSTLNSKDGLKYTKWGNIQKITRT